MPLAPLASGTEDPTVNVLGWREWAALPELEIFAIRAKIDTGARTSAVNASGIEPFDHRGERWIQFTVQPDRSEPHEILCRAGVTDVRVVKDSGGRAEERYVIETPIRLGDRSEEWPIEITLAGRAGMQYAMIVGRTAIRGRFVVDSARSFLMGRPASGDPSGRAS